jgi:hypothetical protein
MNIKKCLIRRGNFFYENGENKKGLVKRRIGLARKLVFNGNGLIDGPYLCLLAQQSN